MKNPAIVFVCMLIIALGTGCGKQSSVTIETETFTYIIGRDGENLQFIYKSDGVDYLDHEKKSYCAQVYAGDIQYDASSVSFDGSRLTVDFDELNVSAVIETTVHTRYVDWKVVSVSGDSIESLVFLNCPLTLKAKPEDPFAACAFALNTYTQVSQLPVLQNHLWAACHTRFGTDGAHIALIGTSQEDILPEIRAIVSQSKDLPYNKVAGAWADEIPFNHGSYLFNFGTLTEENADDWIDMAHSLGFNQIDNHGGGTRFFRFGDFHLNEEKWPRGWDNMKNIVARLHDAGIGSILHTYAFFIDKQSEYVTPVPHPQLDAFRSFTLAEPIGPGDTEIKVDESTADVSTITGFFERNSVTLHIGDELITFSGFTKEPPYIFTGCSRGAHGTGISSHPKGSEARHLKECFGLFVPDCESELFVEIAARHAEIIDYCDFDGFYLDAIDGSDILRGSENTWYWGPKFVYEIYRHLKKPVGMEMSSMWHHMWNFRTRWQAWDYPNRGHKRFIDMHASAVNGGLLLPLHFGWWNFQHFSPPQIEPSFTDVIEYLGCKMIGHNAGLSLTGAVNKENLRTIPAYRRLVDLLHTYEKLRHDNYFDESVRKQLREPGKEFTLFQDTGGTWRFRPAHYSKHKVESLNGGSNTWTADNPFGDRQVKLRIELLMSAAPYNYTGNVTLTDFSESANGMEVSSADGVTSGLTFSIERTKTGNWSGLFTSLNSGKVDSNGAWTKALKTFDPLLDLGKHQALGMWIYGDGKGELLNFRLGSPKHIAYGAVADHYITVDFTGWRYCELIETESTRWSDYTWNDGKGLYNVYRELIDFEHIESLGMWFNDVVPGEEVRCFISPVKALPMVSNTIKNPSVTIDGQTIFFPVTMKSGDYLEFFSQSDCKLYGPKGELIAEVTPVGDPPVVTAGSNSISFTCDEKTGFSTRANVTVIGYGDPL